MKCIGMLVVATAGLTLASVAHAGDASVRMAVRYDDLDLAAAKDAAILVERLDDAARRVCGYRDMNAAENRATRAYAIGRYRLCHEQAMQTAMARIDSIEVQRAFAEHQGRPETAG